MTRRRNHTRKGFNLIESAIVLAVVGAIIGGIWYAAAAVSENRLANKTVEDIFYIAQGLQSKMSAANAASFTGNDITSYAIAAEIFPSDWIQGAGVKSPYGKTTYIWAGSGGFDFAVQVATKSQCIRLLTALHNRGNSSWGNSPIYGLNGVSYLQTWTHPINLMSVSAIQDTDCAVTNEMIMITFLFTQHN